MSSFVLKTVYGDDIRRFTYDHPRNDSAFKYLLKTIRKMYELSSTAALTVKYLDDEGEYITVHTARDWLEAIEFTNGQPLKLMISLKDSSNAQINEPIEMTARNDIKANEIFEEIQLKNDMKEESSEPVTAEPSVMAAAPIANEPNEKPNESNASPKCDSNDANGSNGPCGVGACPGKEKFIADVIAFLKDPKIVAVLPQTVQSGADAFLSGASLNETIAAMTKTAGEVFASSPLWNTIQTMSDRCPARAFIEQRMNEIRNNIKPFELLIKAYLPNILQALPLMIPLLIEMAERILSNGANICETLRELSFPFAFPFVPPSPAFGPPPFGPFGPFGPRGHFGGHGHCHRRRHGPHGHHHGHRHGPHGPHGCGHETNDEKGGNEQGNDAKDGKGNAAVHAHFVCDGCDMSPISGIRYHCTVCSDYDLCAECEAKGDSVHPSAHPMIKIRPPAPVPKDDGPAIHRRVTCDGCGQKPLVGIRYKCTVCNDFDLCETCENKHIHPENHPLIKIKYPQTNGFEGFGRRHRFGHGFGRRFGRWCETRGPFDFAYAFAPFESSPMANEGNSADNAQNAPKEPNGNANAANDINDAVPAPITPVTTAPAPAPVSAVADDFVVVSAPIEEKKEIVEPVAVPAASVPSVEPIEPAAAAPVPAPVAVPHGNDVYTTELSFLNGIGFIDNAANVALLNRWKGDLNKVCNILMDRAQRQ